MFDLATIVAMNNTTVKKPFAKAEWLKENQSKYLKIKQANKVAKKTK